MVAVTTGRGTKYLQIHRVKKQVVIELAFVNGKEGYIDETTISAKDAIEIGMQLIRLGMAIDPGLLQRMSKEGGKAS